MSDWFEMTTKMAMQLRYYSELLASLLLLYLLRKQEVEELYAEYLGWPAVATLLVCGDTIMYAFSYLAMGLQQFAVWAYSNWEADLISWFDFRDPELLIRFAQGSIDAIVLLLPPLAVISMSLWMTKRVLGLAAYRL